MKGNGIGRMKYIAVFDIPDGYGMGCAVAKICPNDGKIREEKDFGNAYAQIEPLSKEKLEIFERFNTVERIICDLGLANAYDMPGFWCNNGKDYKVIETRYNKGYMKATGYDHHKVICYILTNFDTTIEQDLCRIQLCRELNIQPFVMIYDKAHADPVYKAMQRWCNPFIFWKVPTFDEYTRGKRGAKP